MSTFATASRVVVKVGSSSLTTPDGMLDLGSVWRLVDVLAREHGRGREIVLVSSGAIAAGLLPMGLERRPADLASQQAAAAVGQGLLMAHYQKRFSEHGQKVGQVLLTVEDVTRRGHYSNAERALNALIGYGIVPIVNENDSVATHMMRFGDNDRLAALVAQLVQADALVLLTDVDALYTDHPSRPGARRIPVVHHRDELLSVDTSRTGSKVGTGGMKSKVEAATIATSMGIPTLVTSATNVEAVLAGESVGTRFDPIGRRQGSRRRWLAHASEIRGSLDLDAGAVAAVVDGTASLLPVGITAVNGEFEAGDPVELRDEDGVVVARGLVSFDSADLRRVLRRDSAGVVAELGEDAPGEAVHRDVLVVLPQGRRVP